MKKHYYIIFNTLLSLIVSSQYDTSKYTIILIGEDSIITKKPNKADTYLDTGEYKKAVAEYKKLIGEDPSDNELVYNLACAYSLSNEIDSAFKYLQIRLNNDSSLSALKDPDFYNIFKDNRWLLIETQQLRKSEVRAGLKYKYPDITKKLLRMSLNDQSLYRQIELLEKKNGMKSQQADSLWAIKKKINSENIKELEKIIKMYGWPKISVFGSRASGAAFLIIQHSNYKLQKKYLPQIEAACNSNEADWQDFALMKDRILIYEKKPQLYGSQITYNEKTKQYELFNLFEPEKVDSRRAKVGMGSLKDYVLNWGIEFNVSQKYP